MKRRIAVALILTTLVIAGSGVEAGETSNPMAGMAWSVELPMGFDEAMDVLTEALSAEQFSIVSRVDMHTIFKKKLDKDVPPHVILGACNSKLAFKAVSAMPEASLMLPCPVTIRAIDDDTTVVLIGKPDSIMDMSGLDGNPAVAEVGDEAGARLARVVKALQALS
jgi:uncharacterized protein (DUF302 family)